MKKVIQEYKKIIFSLIKLSLPILGGNLSQILVSFSDTIVAGRYSTLALGSISVASAIVMTSLIGAIGLLLGISPLIANLRGMNVRSKKYFKLNLVFALFVSIPFFLVLELILAYIDVFHLSPDMIEPVKQYIAVCAWTVFPTAIFVAVKEFLQAYEKVVFANVVMLVTVVINLILNVVLTFGINTPAITFEGMGVLGLSIATLVSKVFSMVVILIYCIPLFKTPYQKSKKYVKELLKIGAPISVSIFLEFLGFNLTAVLIGMFSALYAGVHNIILCLANLTFMIVLSVSNAASIKIGYYNGRRDILNIKRYSIANIIIMTFICAITFTVLGMWSDEVISIFSIRAWLTFECGSRTVTFLKPRKLVFLQNILK